MSRSRLLAYCVGGFFFFAAVFTAAYLFFPGFRDGAHLFAGVVLTQMVALIIGIAAREGVESQSKKHNGGG